MSARVAEETAAGPGIPVVDEQAAALSPTPRFSAEGTPAPVFSAQPVDVLEVDIDKPIDEETAAARLKAATIVGLYLQGKKRREIAKLLNLGVSTVGYWIGWARRRKLLGNGVEEALARFQNDAVPLAMDGFLDLLESGDKAAIFKALDGAAITGAKDRSGHVPALPTLTINIKMPEGVTPGASPIGVVVGTPHPVIDVTPEAPPDGA